jgi:hypothetical protein
MIMIGSKGSSFKCTLAFQVIQDSQDIPANQDILEISNNSSDRLSASYDDRIGELQELRDRSGYVMRTTAISLIDYSTHKK